MSRTVTVLGLVFAYIVLGTGSARAADGTWTNNANGTWSTAANWSGGAIADGAGSLANFSTADLTASRTITNDSSRTIGRLLFGDLVWNNTGYDWTLSSSGGSILTLDNSGGTGGNPPSITVSNRTTTIGSVLAGANGLTLNLPWSSYDSTRSTPSTGYGMKLVETTGALTFTNINTLSGALVANGGTVRVGGSSGAFGSATALTVTGNGVFTDGDATAANNNNITNRMNASASLTLGGASGGGTFTLVDAAAGYHSQAFSALTVGAGQNTINSSGTTGANTNRYTGASGSVYSRSANGLVNLVTTNLLKVTFDNPPSGSGVSGSGTDAILIGATLDGNDFVGAAAGIVAAPAYNTTLTAGKNVNVTNDLSTSGNLSINSLRLGDTTKRTVTLNSSDTLTLAGGGILLPSSMINQNINHTITNGAITSGTGDLWIYSASGAYNDGIFNRGNASPGGQYAATIASKITGNIALTVSGNPGCGAQVLLSGANDYTGGTFLEGGEIAVNADSGLGNTSGTVTAGSGINSIMLPTSFAFSASRNFVINAGALLNFYPAGTSATVAGIVSGGGILESGAAAGGNPLILTGNNSGFTGQYLVVGFLRAVEGVGLSSSANLLFAGRGSLSFGVLETSNTFTRALGSGAGQVQWSNESWGDAGGGFSAVGGTLTVNIGGNVTTPDTLTWGVGYFLPVLHPNTLLVFGSAGSTAAVTFQNPIALNNAQRGIYVNGTTTNPAIMSGTLSGTGSSGISKQGTGTLVLSGNNTYQGQTTHYQGTLSVASLNSVVGGTASSSLGAPTNAASGTIILGAMGGGGGNNANLTYTGAGETSDRNLEFDATIGQITLNQAGTGLLKFSGSIAVPAVRDPPQLAALILDGSTSGTGELAGSLADGTNLSTVAAAILGTNQLTVTSGVGYGQMRVGNRVSGVGIAPGTVLTSSAGGLSQPTTAALTNNQQVLFTGFNSIKKTGSGTWTLSGANTYSGGTTISGGTLQIGSGGASGTIGLGWVTNNAALVFNRSDSFTVSNNIAGTGSLTVAGTGTTTLLGTNTYSGGTVISNGTLQVGNGGALVSLGSGPVTNNGALVINHSDSLYMNSLSGTGKLTQAGSGTLTIAPSGIGASLTRVSGGVLKLKTIPPDPLIYYNFDNASISGTTVTNLGTGGTAFNGILTGNNMTNATGKLGQAIMTTNSTGMATANTVTIPNAVTLAAWVKSSGTCNWFQRIIDNDYGASVYMGTDSANKFLMIINGTWIYTSQSSSDTANWHHIAMTWNGANAIFYYDGTVITNATLASKNIATSTLKFGFGNNVVANGECWNGALDEAYVFGRALSSNEITGLALNSGASLVPSTASYQVDAGAMLDLGGSTNQQVAGLSGSGVVTNGSLAVTGTLAPGGTNAVGTLTVQGGLTVGANTVVDWNYNDTTQDLINVTGTLSLPAVATVNVSQVVSGKMPSSAVLFSFGSVSNASPNLQQWVINGAAPSTRARIVGNQVKLVTPTGWLLFVQ